jgi:hypothetical protein
MAGISGEVKEKKWPLFEKSGAKTFAALGLTR